MMIPHTTSNNHRWTSATRQKGMSVFVQGRTMASPSFLQYAHHRFHSCDSSSSSSRRATRMHLLSLGGRKCGWSKYYSSDHGTSTTSAAMEWYAAASDDNNVDNTSTSTSPSYIKTADSEWNIPGLRKEVERLVLRCHKKIVKANERYNKALSTLEDLTAPEGTGSRSSSLEDIPSIDLCQAQLNELQGRMSKLRSVEERLALPEFQKRGKTATLLLPEDMVTILLELEVNDAPPMRAPQQQKKKRGKESNTGPRLPYRRYYSDDGTEIRVGKQAEDNDELSCNAQHRDGADWWMHASGCPGSHVVIRSHDATLDNGLVLDAAALAARQSKCQGGVIKVSLTRCRNVTKPPGAKAGLVRINGNVQTIKVNMKEAEVRLKRLDDTVKLN